MPERTGDGRGGAGTPPPAPALTPMPAALTAPGGAVHVAPREGFALWQVAALPGGDAAVAAALGRTLGAPAPGPGRWTTGGGLTAMRLAPRRWWLMAPGAARRESVGCEAPAPVTLDPAAGTALDLGDARVGLEIGGPAAERLMARLVAVDLRRGAAPAGTVLTAPLHGVPVVVAAGAPLAGAEDAGAGAAFTLLLPRSQARSLAAMVAETAASLAATA